MFSLYRCYSTIAFLLLVALQVVAQKKLASPEASRQNSFQDIPVNYYTGSSSVNLPIHTFSEGGISVPLYLSYNASGIRVGETASWCGLGWSLSAGGSITRIIRGKPDEGDASDNSRGFYQLPYNLPTAQTDDQEPDMFLANVNGMVIRFCFNANRVAKTIPESDIQIVPVVKNNKTDNTKRWFSGWKICFPDGSIYYFGSQASDATDKYEYTVTKDLSETFDPSNADKKRIYPSAWYLCKMQTATGQAINLNYRQVYYSYLQLAEYEADQALMGTANQPIQKVNRVYVSSPLIESIEGQNTRILFNRTVSFDISLSDPITGDPVLTSSSFNTGDVGRKDLLSFNGGVFNVAYNGSRLKEIIVQDKTNTAKELVYSFQHEYFNENQTNDLNDYRTATYTGVQLGSSHHWRLKLKSITYPDATQATFYYHAENVRMPSTLSSGVDHWGYFNNTNFGGHLIGTGECQGTSLGSRTVGDGWVRYGALQKMLLSTGLETSLEYELHQARNYTPQVGGLRVARIINKDLVTNQCEVRELSYLNPSTSLSSGFLQMKPVYRFDYPGGAATAGYGYNSWLYSYALARSGRPTVGYKFVKETVYSGTIDMNQWTMASYKNTFKVKSTLYEFDQDETEVDVCTSSNGFSYKPWAYNPKVDVRSGLMKTVIEYAKNDVPVSRKGMTYTFGETTTSLFTGYNFVRYNNKVNNNSLGQHTYTQYSSLQRVKTDTTKVYNQTGSDFVPSVVTYTYKNEMPAAYRTTYPGTHQQLVEVATTDVNNLPIVTRTKYAADYVFGTQATTVQDCIFDETSNQYVCNNVTQYVPIVPTNAQPDAQSIYCLQTKNVWAGVIETVVRKNSKVVSASYVKYDKTLPVPKETYRLDNFPLTTFNEFTMNSTSLAVVKDANYILGGTVNSYNTLGFPTSVTQNFGTTTVTNYGVNNLLPLTVTQNSGQPSAQTVTHEYAVPLYGLSKKIGPNGAFNTYDYEAATGRLSSVKDRNGFILKQYEYKAKGQ